MIRPPSLLPGDTIGIAAPASAFRKEDFTRGIERLREAGYEVIVDAGIHSRNGYLAGTDERRARELTGLFLDGRVRAILCARGGYGSMRILPLLNAALLRRNATILMGYSDITALHLFLQRACGMVSFHGPLVTELGGLTGADVAALLRPLSVTEPWGPLETGPLDTLRGGRAEGRLTGGSLSLVSAMMGTAFQPEAGGALLFFEDRGEKPYAVDRMVRHLSLCGLFDAACGVILGRFIPPEGWRGDPRDYESEIGRIFLEATGGRRIPVAAGFPAGHSPGSICFPLGTRVRLDADSGTASIIEPCLKNQPRSAR